MQVGDTVSITKAAVAVRNVITLINGNIVTFASSWVVPGGGYAGTEIVVQETFNVNVIDNTGKTAFPAPFTNMRVSSLAKANYFVNVINGTASSPIFVTDSAPSLPPTQTLGPTWTQFLSSSREGWTGQPQSLQMLRTTSRPRGTRLLT